MAREAFSSRSRCRRRRIAAVALALLLPAGTADGADDPVHVVVRDADGAVLPADVMDILRPALHVYRDRDGLPQNTAMALAFDPAGALWVGTQDGIVSFDGTAWSVATLPRAQVSSFVRTLLVDHEGTLWVGRQDGGLSALSAEGTWTTYDTAQGLPSPRVDALVESTSADGHETLWAGTRAGLFRREGSTWRAFDGNDALPAKRITRLLAGRDDDGAPVVWVGTEAGVARIRDDRVSRIEGAPREAVSALLQTRAADGTSTLWVGARDAPLARCVRGAWTFTGAPALPDEGIGALAETQAPDGSSVIWAGTERGIWRLERGRWIRLPDDALSSHDVRTFAKQPPTGPTSDLWIGLDTGLARVHLGGWRSLDHALGLPEDSAYAELVTRGADGGDALWIGTRSGGLSRYEAGRWHTFGPRDGFAPHTVYALAEHQEPDGTRSIYVGAQDGGLLRYDGHAFSVVDGHEAVRQMFGWQDPSAGPVLDVTFSDGVLLRHAGDRWDRIDHPSGAPFDDVFATLETVLPDGRRAVWVATHGGGLARLLDGAWSTFSRASGEMRSDTVLSVMVAPGPGGHRELWAGTEGGGISVADLDARPMTWTTLTSTTQPALPDDTVYHAEADAQGRVYAFTNRGVARIVRRPTANGTAGDLAVETFTTEDGLPANEFNGGTGTLDHDGRLWAGTVAGVTVLDPSNEVAEPAPRLRWASRTAHGSGPALVDGDLLSWDDADLAVDTTLVALFRGAETRYRVELTSGDGKNVTTGAWRSDRHRELPPLRAFGTAEPYTLRAWTMDYGGTVRGPEVVRFRVRPAPWLTVWAFALYAAGGIAGVWGTVRVRLRAVERRNRELEVRVTDRTRELGEKVHELAVSERAARAAQDEAMRANRAKTTFLSTMSHELRTPLNAILGFAQLLARDRGLSADSRESVDVVAKSGEHLLGLINDVLSITRIEAGRLVLEETTFVLSDVVGAVEKMTRVRARSKRLSLQVEVDAGTHATVRGDEGKLRQILLNLVGNAVKFTREGGVAVRSRWVDGRATFEVEDTGPGIPPADLAGLFEPFVQTETGRQAKEGTGLGLFISRSYARLMGGDVHVESRLGQGTIFRVELPLPRGDAVAPSMEAPRVVGMAPGQGPYRVLIVDDAPDNRRLLARLLAEVGGFEVREAANGLEAVRLFGEHRPDVTWMDLRMDGLDGIAATAAIREREASEGWHRSVILALSASAFERDRQWLVESGCDEFIAKPYRESTIFEALTRHLSIVFVHEGQTKSEPRAASVAPERIGRLPAPLRTRLREAARSGDLRGARAAVVEVAGLDDELANGLRAMVDAFRLEEIEAMLGKHG